MIKIYSSDYLLGKIRCLSDMIDESKYLVFGQSVAMGLRPEKENASPEKRSK